MRILQFWKSALLWAVKRTFAVWRWTPETAFLYVFAIVVGSVAHYQRQGWPAVLGELHVLVDYGLIPAVLGFVILFAINIFRAPAVLYWQVSDYADTLERRLTPGLRLSIGDEGVESLPRGTSTMTGGGQIQSNRSGYDRVVRIHCLNDKAVPAENAEAHLVDLFELDENGQCLSIGFSTSVRLSWTRKWIVPWHLRKEEAEERAFSKTIPAHGKAPFYVAKQFGTKSVHLMGEEELFEYRHIFDERKRFRAVIQVTATGMAPAIANVDFSFDAEGCLLAAYAGESIPKPDGQLRSLPSRGLAPR